MAEVYISYRHIKPDQDLAAELSEYLTGHRVSYFRDTDIRIGQKWAEAIERELRAAKSIVVFLSAESMLSDMVREEIMLAHQLNKPLFPVRVDYDSALPYDLGAYLNPIQHRLWRPGEPFEPICGAILNGISVGWAQDGIEPSSEALRRLNEVSELRGAPLPASDPRLETGGIKLNSPFYVRRSADEKVERLVTQPGETILIKGPRQVGKTSLAARAKAAAESNGQRTCYIDFQLIDESNFRESKTLIRYLCARLAKDFDTVIKPDDVWDDRLGATDSLTDFIERAVLSNASAPVVVCLDEVDSVFRSAYCDSFFGMLRGWHNRRATHPVWNRFNLMIAHSTEPALFIRDRNQSPFNVGSSFRLGDFDRDDILWLNAKHGGPLKGDEDVERLIHLVGGHPYLVRQAFYSLSADGASIGRLEQVASDDEGPFGDHLRRLLWVLRDQQQLRKTLQQVLNGNGCDDEDAFQRLLAAGFVVGESRKTAHTRCELYVRYMRDHL